MDQISSHRHHFSRFTGFYLYCGLWGKIISGPTGFYLLQYVKWPLRKIAVSSFYNSSIYDFLLLLISLHCPYRPTCSLLACVYIKSASVPPVLC